MRVGQPVARPETGFRRVTGTLVPGQGQSVSGYIRVEHVSKDISLRSQPRDGVDQSLRGSLRQGAAGGRLVAGLLEEVKKNSKVHYSDVAILFILMESCV